MATQASVPLDLAMVEGLVHPPRTLYHLTPPPPAHPQNDKDNEESREESEDDE
jgi:hypothetical protein